MSSRHTGEYLDRVSNLVEQFGIAGAAEKMGVQRETVRRRLREIRSVEPVDVEQIDDNLLARVRDRFSDAELRKMLNNSNLAADSTVAEHSFEGDQLSFGVITDTHIGSKYTDPAMLEKAFEVFEQNDVDFICHAGDVHEGLSHRAGHYHECSHVGYSAQLEESRRVFGQWRHTPIYIVDGNHDRWYIKSNGALIVDELCRDQDNLYFLGHDEGDIKVDGVTIKLWHGEDGSSYAFSYRIQKIVESFTGGEKPNILICGHTHKALYMFDRHIHCLSAGSMQKQSKWMRGKRHASHTGFYVVHMAVNNNGVAWFEPRFYPFYM